MSKELPLLLLQCVYIGCMIAVTHSSDICDLTLVDSNVPQPYSGVRCDDKSSNAIIQIAYISSEARFCLPSSVCNCNFNLSKTFTNNSKKIFCPTLLPLSTTQKCKCCDGYEQDRFNACIPIVHPSSPFYFPSSPPPPVPTMFWPGLMTTHTSPAPLADASAPLGLIIGLAVLGLFLLLLLLIGILLYCCLCSGGLLAAGRKEEEKKDLDEIIVVVDADQISDQKMVKIEKVCTSSSNDYEELKTEDLKQGDGDYEDYIVKMSEKSGSKPEKGLENVYSEEPGTKEVKIVRKESMYCDDDTNEKDPKVEIKKDSGEHVYAELV